jgi:DNA-binding NarL/FixJ family response regulator
LQNITLAIADDHKLFRQGIITTLSAYAHLQVVIEAVNGQDLLNQIKAIAPKPHIAIINLEMSVMNGIVAVETLKKMYPEIKVIALSMHNEEKFVIKMLNMGVNSYLFKNTEPEELVLAIETVMHKDHYFNEEVGKILLKNLQNKKKTVKKVLDKNELLTQRELQVLTLLCQGDSSAEIAIKILVNKRTVEFHRQNLLNKLKVKNTASLIVYAVQHGLVKL